MQDYQAITQWLFDQVPTFQFQGKNAYKPGLEAIKAFCRYLGSPEKELKTIHVGGTNGKGSTAHLIAAALQTCGHKVGLYTSPHLVDFSERIRINGCPVDQAFVCAFVEEHRSYFLSHKLSFFEITVGMAFAYFTQQKVDYALIEVGLGGRLDATNVITPLLSVITNIGLDHTEFLGDSKTQIAFEKGGIIKPHVPVVIGEKDVHTAQIFKQKAEETHSTLVFAQDFPNASIATDLKGRYQAKNVHTAWVALQTLFSNFPLDVARQAFARVVSLTGLRGRWEVLAQNPLIVADVTHNREGFEEVILQWHETPKKELHLVLGFVKGKPLEEILARLPKSAHYYFCAPHIERAQAVEYVAHLAQEHALTYQVFPSVEQAFYSAQTHAQKEDLIYIGGSTFVVAEVLSTRKMNS